MTDTTSTQADPAATGPGAAVPPARTDTRAEPTSQVSFGTAQFIVALCILVVYIASIWLMFQHRADAQWDRMVYLFTGFEAIVFVAAGAIFGTRIQRASVAAAHEQSRQAREDLHAERVRADRGAQLEEAATVFIKALKAFEDEEPLGAGNGHASGTSADRIGKRGDDEGATPLGSRSGLSFAIKLAEELFPQGWR